MKEEDINCQFMPVKLLEQAVEMTNSRTFFSRPYGIVRCKQNLWQLQEKRCLNPRGRLFGSTTYRWASLFNFAVRKAVYSHDWDGLLSLLRASPVWEHQTTGRYHTEETFDIDIYYKAYIILLTHHPRAKELGLLDEYLHMVQSCRSEKDKKAMIKVLHALPDKIISRNSHPFNTTENAKKKEKSEKLIHDE